VVSGKVCILLASYCGICVLMARFLNHLGIVYSILEPTNNNIQSLLYVSC